MSALSARAVKAALKKQKQNMQTELETINQTVKKILDEEAPSSICAQFIQDRPELANLFHGCLRNIILCELRNGDKPLSHERLTRVLRWSIEEMAEQGD